MTENMTGKKFMSPSELGKRIGKSSKTIRRWIQNGTIKAEMYQGSYGQEYQIPIDEAERIIRESGVRVNDQDNVRVESEHVRGEEIEEIRLPVPLWEQFQRELNGAAFKAGQLEGQLREVQDDRQRLRNEVVDLKGTVEELTQKLISQAQVHQEDMLKRMEDRDKTVTDLITSWREAASEKVEEEQAPEKKGFWARLFGGK